MSYSNNTVPTDRVDVQPDDARTHLLHRISWGAVFAGIVSALVMQLLINLLGLGIGLSSFSATDTGSNPDASTFSLATAAWFTLSGILGGFFGGAVAGRLSGSSHVQTARWHGFVSWAATALLLVYLLTSAVGSLVGGATGALGSVIGATGRTAGSAVSSAVGVDPQGLESQVKNALSGNDAQSVQQNVTTYIRASISGDKAAADAARDRAVDGLAKSANISPDEARKRLDDLQQQATQAAATAKDKAAKAAEASRKATADAGFFGFVALVLGALAAWIGGGVGAPHRELAVTGRTRV
jgi:polyhydroxyalkanoate synthesis regulator phasin